MKSKSYSHNKSEAITEVPNTSPHLAGGNYPPVYDRKLTEFEWLIIVCFSTIAYVSYLSVFVIGIISEFYGYNYLSQTSVLLFLILASLNVLIVVQIVKLFIFKKINKIKWV